MTRALRTLLVVGALLGAAPAVVRAAPGLRLGFGDDPTFVRAPSADQVTGLQHAKSADASFIRFFVSWAQVAPGQPPSSAVARDPGWSGYQWAPYDTTIRNITAAGMTPIPVMYIAPSWAEGPGRPAVSSSAPKGTWKPSASALADFATAAATRYSGHYTDPTTGLVLPRVKYWQGWNEPNLSTYLTPQWKKTSKGYVPESPTLYRKMQNAFYAAVKKVAKTNFVPSAGTAPFGDLHPGDLRMQPAQFWRTLLCVSGRAHPKHAKSCPGKIHFDALDHHPYPIGPPRRHAINADDVVIPDYSKLTKPLAVAERAGTVLPRGKKRIWATEVSWDSFPDPDGLSLSDQARYLEGALYVLRHEGVSVVVWFLMRDMAPSPSYATTYQSGIFLRGPTIAQDTPKPSFTAFRFPFTAYRYSGVARLWGMAPAAGGRVTIQAKSGSSWTTVTKLHAGSNRVFTGKLRVSHGTVLRAVEGTDISLSWTSD